MLFQGYRKTVNAAKVFVMLGLVCEVFMGLRASGQTTAQKQVRVAAAADLQPVMPALAYAFQKEKGIKLVVSFGSSATLATQIVNGEPVDVFLGADYTFPEKVVAAGLTDAKSPTAYAKGTLVLWARKDSPFQPLHLEALSDPRLKSVAIGNELHAPYGRAAASALRYLKLYDTVAPKLVVAESISQAAQFVESGNAQLGLISLTAAESAHFKEVGSYVLVPPVSYPKIVQYGVVLKNSPVKAEAKGFLDWLTSHEVQEKLAQFGLQPVN